MVVDIVLVWKSWKELVIRMEIESMVLLIYNYNDVYFVKY